MIEIKCAADNAAPLCEACGVQAMCGWEMTERGERLGFSLVQADGDRASVVWLEAPDAALTDALLRATLNALLAQGVKRAILDEPSVRDFAVKKGYLGAGGPFELEIRDFFSKSSCKG